MLMIAQEERIIKTPIKGMTEADWLAEREKSIGGSEIGAILGMNPFMSAYTLWARRTGKIPPFTGNVATKVGTFLEECVAQLFSDTSGLKVQRTNFLYRNAAFPWLHASPDRLIVGQKSGVEIKTTSALNVKRFKNGTFPETYYAQSVQYMAVLEYERWYVAVLIGNNDFRIYQLTSIKDDTKPEWCESSLYVDEDEVKALIEAGRMFYEGNLLTGIPPAPDGSEDAGETVGTIYAESDGSEAVLDGAEALVNEYKDIETSINALEKSKEAIKQKLQVRMGTAETGLAGAYKITWKPQERKTFDAKAFAERNPQICLDPYYKTTSYRVFKIK